GGGAPGGRAEPRRGVPAKLPVLPRAAKKRWVLDQYAFILERCLSAAAGERRETAAAGQPEDAVVGAIARERPHRRVRREDRPALVVGVVDPLQAARCEAKVTLERSDYRRGAGVRAGAAGGADEAELGAMAVRINRRVRRVNVNGETADRQ